MKKFIYVLVALILLSALTVWSEINNPQPAEVLFTDDFDQSTLDRKKWVTCYDWTLESDTGCTNFGNDEQQWYTDDGVAVVDGNLVLSADRIDMDGRNRDGDYQYYPYRSGMVSTGRNPGATDTKWSGTYGYYEARMKLPSGQALWPAFWLLPDNEKWPPEIDIVELVGSAPDEVLLTNHWAGPDGEPAKLSRSVQIDSAADEWHVFAVDWNADYIKWYIDDRLVRSYTGDFVPDQPMEIIINLAVGGRLPGMVDETTPDNAQLLIDYIRVYNKRPKA